MKKILVMMVFMIGMMLNGVGDVKADCPAGFNQKLTTIELFGCDYSVGICYTCPLTTPPIIQLLHVIKMSDNPPCEHDPVPQRAELLLAVEEVIFSNEYIFNELCGISGDAPPCDDEVNIRTFKTRRAFCWEEDFDGIYVCDTSNYCETEWKICWEEGLGHQIVELSSTKVGSSTCTYPCFSIGTTKCD